MEVGELVGQGVDVFRTQLPLSQAAIEQSGLRELDHLDGKLDAFFALARLLYAGDARTIRRAKDRHDGKIKLGRKPAVEPQLVLAGDAALVEPTVIKKGKLDGLFDLVGIVSGQQHVRSVSF